jgi:hypothetical protein
MSKDFIGISISVIALIISATTAWLTLFRRGTVKMTQPTVIFFGTDDGRSLKVFLRTLLYSTAKRGHIVESMWVKLRRSESSQIFNIWVYGDASLTRGSGLHVGENGLVCNHHFLLPRDGTTYEFLAGEYAVEIYASLVNSRNALLLSRLKLLLTQEHSTAIRNKVNAGIYFDWGPDSMSYHASIDERSVLAMKLSAIQG